MKFLKTRQELEKVVGDKSFGYIPIERKMSYDDFHEGHEYLVNYSKNNFDLTVVTFWDTLELMYIIYKVPNYEQDLGKPWNPEICFQWCEDHGVDYALAPDDGYSQQYLDSVGYNPIEDTNRLMEWVADLWEKEGYNEYSLECDDASPFNGIIKAKTFILLQKLKKPLNCNFISSWKDGESRLIIADYINKHTTENYIILDPLKSTDKIYYSTSLKTISEETKSILAKIESTVLTDGYDDLEALKTRINSLDRSKSGFYVRRIDLIEGGVAGSVNDYINIQYSVGQIEDSYPIYLKGVRTIEEQPTRESK